MSKPRIAIFDFACCEGCQLQIVNLEESILDVLAAADIVQWREAMSEQSHEYDIAIVEGSIMSPKDEERLKIIRSRARILIAIGACATTGGVNKLKNNFEMDDVGKCVYKDASTKEHVKAYPTKAADEVVKVDYYVHGCPMHRAEFEYVMRCLLLGKRPDIPDYPVCVECKANGNPCLWDYGEVCLGPIIRAGCGARCPSEGFRCFGCRGYIDNPNVKAAKDVIEKHNLSVQDLKSKMVLFGSDQEPTNE